MPMISACALARLQLPCAAMIAAGSKAELAVRHLTVNVLELEKDKTLKHFRQCWELPPPAFRRMPRSSPSPSPCGVV